MEGYSINYVEQLTGIKAHTLRIWEKRYQTLIPHRTDTKIRYYDDNQLRKLLNIATLLQQGHKISAAMSYTDEKINDLILQTHQTTNQDDLNQIYINNLISAMIALDEPLFDKIFSGIVLRFGIYDTIVKVIYPFLRLTGVLWSTLNVIPTQEHFASNIIRRKLCAAIDGIPYKNNKATKFLLFLPPDEWHEIGLLLADYMIRSAGYQTLYLGQNLPYSNLAIAVIKFNPNYLVTFFAQSTNLDMHIKPLSQILATHSNLTLLLCSAIPSIPVTNDTNFVILDNPIKIFNYLGT